MFCGRDWRRFGPLVRIVAKSTIRWCCDKMVDKRGEWRWAQGWLESLAQVDFFRQGDRVRPQVQGDEYFGGCKCGSVPGNEQIHRLRSSGGDAQGSRIGAGLRRCGGGGPQLLPVRAGRDSPQLGLAAKPGDLHGVWNAPSRHGFLLRPKPPAGRSAARLRHSGGLVLSAAAG